MFRRLNQEQLTELLKRPQVLDGGFATELERDGYDFSNAAMWSSALLLDNPEVVIPIHKRFLAAGARILESNTYKFTQELCMKDDETLDSFDARQIGMNGVKMARRAVDQWRRETDERSRFDPVIVAGAIGPYATVLDCDVRPEQGRPFSCYTGEYMDFIDEKVITGHHFNQAELMYSAGADILAFETIPSVAEARCILRALDKLPYACAYIAFSCKSDTETCHGDLFSLGVSLCLSHPRVLAVGVNCSNPAFVTPLLKSAAPNAQKHNKPFIVYPNSGEMYEDQDGLFFCNWTHREEHSWRECVREWHQLGARIFGGCCRVHPEHIAEISRAVDEIRSNKPNSAIQRRRQS